MKKEKTLITGGTGFLGSYLVESLLEKSGEDIVIFDRLKDYHAENNQNRRIKYFKGNVLSKKDVGEVFKTYGPFKTVYHLVALMPHKVNTDESIWNTNVNGTANFAAESAQNGVKTFILTSTNVIYGIPDILPVTEDTPVRPIEVYGRSKVQAEAILARYKNRMNIQILRCPVIMGARRLGLQAMLFDFIADNKNVYVLGDGLNKYQFADPEDVVSALTKASKIKGFDIYNIGADDVLSLKQIYEKIIEFANSRSKIVSLPRGPAITVLKILDKLNVSPFGIYQYTMIGESYFADTTKIKKKLGWKPKMTNLDSFIKNYQWYLENRNNFTRNPAGKLPANRSLPEMGIFKLLKMIS